MTSMVLDTNVVSELVRLQPEPKVVEVVRSVEVSLVSAIVFPELSYGSDRPRDANKKFKFDLFIEGVKAVYEDRIVEFDLKIAGLAGRLRARASRSGWVLSQFDPLIGATAIVKSAGLATRNIVDFERLEASLVNPWDA